MTLLQVPAHTQDTTTWNIIQVAAAVGCALVLAVARKLPDWLGFIFMLAASGLIIGFGFAEHAYKFLPLGFACLIGTIIAWASGASAKPEGDDDSLGGTADAIPMWAWLIIAGLLVVAIILSIVIK